MMKRAIWKAVVLNWVMLMAAANSNPSQPNWTVAGNYPSATACIAALGQNIATSSITSSITSEIAGWASNQLGTGAPAAGMGAAVPPTNVAPMVCLPDSSPWVASVGGSGGGGPVGPGPGNPESAAPAPPGPGPAR